MWWCGRGSVFSVLCCFGVEVESMRFFGYLKGQNAHPFSIIFLFVQNLDFGDPWVSILAPFGHPWAPFWCLFGGLDPLGDHSGTFGGQMSCLAALGSVFHGFWGLQGGHFGVLFSMFSDFLVSKWELKLWTSFLVHSRWKKDLKMMAFCC